MPEAEDHVALVLRYVEAAQRARTTQSSEDLSALEGFLAPDLEIKMASAWADEPWRVVSTTAQQLLERFTAPINRGSVLTTENVNAVPAGEDVLVEQLSTITRDGRSAVSMVCHLFTVRDGRIAAIRAYRNDAGLPPG